MDKRVKTTERELLEAIATHEDPFVTSTEIAEDVVIGQQGVYKRLENFEEEGYLLRKRVGASGTIWWLTHDGRKRLSRLQDLGK